MANERAKSIQLKQGFQRARVVRPTGITGRETPGQIIEGSFPAFVGRQERTAYELMKRAVDEDFVVFLTMSGAMTPAGLHSSCIIPLIERGLIDVITTTGANLYHDVHRVLGHQIREIDPNAGDLALRLSRIIRIYDLGFWEDVLLETDRLLCALLRKPQFQRTMTTPEFHYLLGQEVAALEVALGVEQPSLLATAYRRGIPIFVGAVQDGSIFLNAVQLKKLLPPGEFRLNIDVNDDVFAMGAMQHYCSNALSRPMAVWMLGGGVPKNYTLQGEPLLDQIFGVPAAGFDIDVQFCVDPVDNGALSSCTAGEGHTWGKISPEGVATSVYCHSDVTAVFPWMTYALLADQARKRPYRRLMDKLDAAVSLLDDIARRSIKKLPPLEKSLPPNVVEALAAIRDRPTTYGLEPPPTAAQPAQALVPPQPQPQLQLQPAPAGPKKAKKPKKAKAKTKAKKARPAKAAGAAKKARKTTGKARKTTGKKPRKRS